MKEVKDELQKIKRGERQPCEFFNKSLYGNLKCNISLDLSEMRDQAMNGGTSITMYFEKEKNQEQKISKYSLLTYGEKSIFQGPFEEITVVIKEVDELLQIINKYENLTGLILSIICVILMVSVYKGILARYYDNIPMPKRLVMGKALGTTTMRSSDMLLGMEGRGRWPTIVGGLCYPQCLIIWLLAAKNEGGFVTRPHQNSAWGMNINVGYDGNGMNPKLRIYFDQFIVNGQKLNQTNDKKGLDTSQLEVYYRYSGGSARWKSIDELERKFSR